MAGGAKETGKTEMRDFKELSLEELRRGYVTQADGTHTCIFCGETFESGVIYHSHGRDVTAERAVREHMEDVHSGTFWPMIELEKTLNGLTDVQKTMLACLYDGHQPGHRTCSQVQFAEGKAGGQDPSGAAGAH